jgi:hypothetical protein
VRSRFLFRGFLGGHSCGLLSGLFCGHGKISKFGDEFVRGGARVARIPRDHSMPAPVQREGTGANISDA